MASMASVTPNMFQFQMSVLLGSPLCGAALGEVLPEDGMSSPKAAWRINSEPYAFTTPVNYE